MESRRDSYMPGREPFLSPNQQCQSALSLSLSLSLSLDLFENVASQNIVDFIKETHFYKQL